MSSTNPQLDSYLKNLGERLLLAGWATAIYQRDGKTFHPRWTRKGLVNLRLLREILKDFGDDYIPAGEISALRAIAISGKPRRRRKTKRS